MYSQITPRKSLGQHWLTDDSALDKICSAADITNEDTVLEIGPGLGSLSEKLLEKAKKVIAVELDSKLTKALTTKFRDTPNIEILNHDILDFDFSLLPKDYKVVANIPYYLTSNLIRKLSETPSPPSLAVLLVQKEIAVRVAASPGQMSLLSITAQYYWQAEKREIIPSYLFTPPPKVDSQIILLTRKEQKLLNSNEEQQFFRVVKAGFSQKRKKILNGLSAGLKLNKTDVERALKTASIDVSRRPQTLSIEEWVRVYRSLLDMLSKPA